MKKFLLCICLISVISSLYSFEWGGILFNDTKIQKETEDYFLKQQERVSLWFRVPLSQEENTYFLADGHYDFSYEEKIIQSLDINLFKLGMIIPLSFYTSLQFDIGRFFYKDITQHIISQSLDGIAFNFFNEDFSCNAIFGYTGLLNAHSVSYTFSPVEYNETSLYPMSPKFFITSLRLAFSQLFLQQDVQLEWDGTWDISKNNYQRMYASFALNGEIFRNMYYIFSSDFAFECKKNSWEKGLANLTQFELVYYPSVWDSAVTFSSLFATGKTANTRDFLSFNALDIDYFGIHSLSNVMKNSLAFSAKPFDCLYLGLTNSLFMNFATEENDFMLHGLEFCGTVLWQIFSDFALSNETFAYMKFSDSSLKFGTSIKVEFKF